ncbi:MAG TPA: GNAT family N-acetyltransferase [Solirubrobacteraceae bacterium]|nr:GNAT family N-acetyltransferase [Solirubrobacteraceae bacterium]
MIRRLDSGDWDAWLPLWRGYLRFYREELPEETTRLSFERLSERRDGMLGLIALGDADEAIGLAHLVFHPATWSASDKCYLEDLFVSKGARGGGWGRALIEAVYAEADAAGASNVYWHTQQFNAAGRSLYDTVAHNTSFIVYEHELGK